MAAREDSTAEAATPGPAQSPISAPGTKIAFNVTNLQKWETGNILQFYSLGSASVEFDLENAAVGAPVAGDTALAALTFDYANATFANRIESGDKAYVTQLAVQPLAGGDDYWSLTRVFAIPPFVLDNGTTTTRAYYDSWTDDSGALTVNLVFGTDDVWPLPGKLALTYCIGSSTGAHKGMV